MNNIITSSLLCLHSNKQEFIHDTMQEFYLAKYFAEKINNNEMSIGTFWKEYASYEEDADLWELPKDQEWRALLPSYKTLLPKLTNMLKQKKIEELVKIISKNYFKYEKKFDEDYNPFIDEILAIKILLKDIKKNKRFSEILKINNPFLFENNYNSDYDKEINQYPYEIENERMNKEEYPQIKTSINTNITIDTLIKKISNKKNKDDKNKTIIKLLGLKDKKATKYVIEYIIHDLFTLEFIESLKITKNKILEEHFIKYLENPNNKYKERIAIGLGLMGNNKATNILINNLKSYYNLNIPETIYALGNLNNPKAINSLIKLLNDKYNPYQKETISTLRNKKDTRIINALIHYVNNNINNKYNNDTLIEAIEILTLTNNKEAIELTLNYIKKNKESSEIMSLLGNVKDEKIKNEKIIPFLFEYINNENNPYIPEAISLLGQMRNESIIPFLFEYVKNDNDHMDDAISVLMEYKKIPPVYEKYKGLYRLLNKQYSVAYHQTKKIGKNLILDIIADPDKLTPVYEVLIDELTTYKDKKISNKLYNLLIDHNVEDKGFISEALSRIGNKKIIKKLRNYIYDSKISDIPFGIHEINKTINDIHLRLKPKGYNPAVKKLSDE